jgi:hypothetical protein
MFSPISNQTLTVKDVEHAPLQDLGLRALHGLLSHVPSLLTLLLSEDYGSAWFIFVYLKHLKDLRATKINWSVPLMKTLRISDDVHQKLTALLGELMAQTSKMQTYQDAIEAMLYQSVTLPPELIGEVERFIQTHKWRGYTTKEEFIAKPYGSSLNGKAENMNT